jgi:rhamnosyltransferase
VPALLNETKSSCDRFRAVNMERSSIAAVIVLYNPDEQYVVENIHSCLTQVQHTFLIDNSEKPDVRLVSRLKGLSNASYTWNNGNLGIANALNVASRKAQNLNYEWLLTLDQDTLLPSQYVEQMRLQAELLAGEQVGILAPSYQDTRTIGAGGHEDHQHPGVRTILFTMTSGNLLNLRSYAAVGGFMDELFIDHVDHEYCLRLNARGYKVFETPAIVLTHKPGREARVTARVQKLNFASHSPLRLYYFCRNGLKVSQLYTEQFPRFRRFFINELFKQLLKIIFLESDKIKRIKMIVKGYRDFKRNKFGALKN